MGKLEQARELLEELSDAGHPQEVWTYLLSAYDLVAALREGLMGEQLHREFGLPARPVIEDSPYRDAIMRLHELLNHPKNGVRRDNVASKIAEAKITTLRRDLSYFENNQLGSIMIPKDLKRVEWVPEKIARRQEAAKPKPDVSGLKQGFLVQDLGVIRAFLSAS